MPQISEKELTILIEKEMELIMQVKLEKQRTDAINAVEEYVYHMRDTINGDLQDYILEEVRLTCIWSRAVQQRLINRYSVVSFSIWSADFLTNYSGGVKLVD